MGKKIKKKKSIVQITNTWELFANSNFELPGGQQTGTVPKSFLILDIYLTSQRVLMDVQGLIRGWIIKCRKIAHHSLGKLLPGEGKGI